MNAVLASILFMLRSCFRTRATMHIEILALRHQLAVLQRRTNKRASLRTVDRLLWGITFAVMGGMALSACRRQAGNSNRVAPKRGFDGIGVGRVGQGRLVDRA